MSILAHQKSRDASAGWVTDFGEVIGDLVPSLREQPNLKIVTNAGGMNPRGCAAAIARRLVQQGFSGLVIGTVSGDDLLPRLDELSRAGESFEHFETGQPIDSIRDRIVSANAYLGARGIVEALDGGADRRDRTRGRRIVDSRAGRPRIRMGLGRLGSSGRCHRGRSPDRMRRSVHRRNVLGLASGDYPFRHRVSDRRDVGGSPRRHHETCGKRWQRQCGNGGRTARVRDWRPGALLDPRRRYRLLPRALVADGGGPRGGQSGARDTAAGDAESLARLSGRLHGVGDLGRLRATRRRERASGWCDHPRSTCPRRRQAGKNAGRSFGRRRHASRFGDRCRRPSVGSGASRQRGRSVACWCSIGLSENSRRW